MIDVGLFIKTNNEFLRVDFFDDEKISINSSVQNIADISKTFTDFSQSFTVPASKQNNTIFEHWYESSVDNGFNSNLKVDAYIELDTIPFRVGKVQLEGATVKNGSPENYSLNFIGNLGNLKDKFAGLMLKDLTSTAFNFNYTPTVVKDKVTFTPTSANVMFPLISSDRYWNLTSGTNNIGTIGHPIRYNELFPALRLQSILKMIETQFGVDFGITSNRSVFLNNNKFLNAYLWLKNSEDFVPILTTSVYDVNNVDNSFTPPYDPAETTMAVGYLLNDYYWTTNLTNNTFTTSYIDNVASAFVSLTFIANSTGTGTYKVQLFNITDNFIEREITLNGNQSGSINILLANKPLTAYHSKTYQVRFMVFDNNVTINSASFIRLRFEVTTGGGTFYQREMYPENLVDNIYGTGSLIVAKQMPEIKIEDFFSGILKMFNMTCFSTDGINYTLQRLDDFYTSGNYIDITEYVDKESATNIQRVKTYKKINFEFEKSESIVNVGFLGANGVEYGSLLYETGYDGEEYNIKLPFEDLNFANLKDLLQVGYALKSDLAKYVPKPIVLYDYNSTALNALTATTYYFSTALSGSGSTTAHTSYKSFGQETLISGETFSLNFPSQISTLTNEFVENGLYLQNYDAYLGNIFNIKSRIIKIKTYLPTSILTKIKLNDRLIIRDKRYIINTMNLDLTTSEVQFELLNDFR